MKKVNPPQARAQARSKGRKSRAIQAQGVRTAPASQRTKSKPSLSSHKGVSVVGIGASAGGLETFTQLLTQLPSNTGLAIVLVQHLDPRHESSAAEILARSTSLPVTEVEDGVKLQPNHVYVIPPDRTMTLEDGVLRLQPRAGAPGPNMVIDAFFESLAATLGGRAVGVVLSGTATDGTRGLCAIKAAGGLTFAQNPKSAKFDGMPRSAIASGKVDFVLDPAEIGEELARIAKHPYNAPVESPKESSEDEAPLPSADPLAQIFALLRKQTRVDFTEYKQSTVRRRIARRLMICRHESLEQYLSYLHKHPEEVQALFNDILIHVTTFFRNPKAYKALAKHVLPHLIKERGRGVPIRIWVPGCSTGEEAYSLAILLLELLGDNPMAIPVQIFATDISEPAIQKARAGEYPQHISREVSKERLRRFFVKTDEGYRVTKQVRETCLFSRHDLTCDSPFAKIDLVSCRNLLIYFSAALQKRIIPVFHYALNPGGFLWLGRSETIAGYSNLFEAVDKANRIFAQKVARPGARLPVASLGSFIPRQGAVPTASEVAPMERFDLQQAVDRALSNEFAPPGVVVDDNMQVLQVRGRVTPYLELAPGQPNHHLLKLARPEIGSDLRMLLQSAKKKRAAVKSEGLQIMDDAGRTRNFTIRVTPLQSPASNGAPHFLVLFEAHPAAEPPDAAIEAPLVRGPRSIKTSKGEAALQRRIAKLERELAATKEYQSSLAEEYETAHEDLAAANEEFQSTNEEMQSTNEELETAKEELQSTNEELTTVNEELQSRNAELAQANNDLVNLLGSVDIPIVMVGLDGRIRNFSPKKAARVLNLISSDLGRPISHIRLSLNVAGQALDLDRIVTEVMNTMEVKEFEVQDREGHWFRLQVRPYRTTENKIDGAVLAFIDIDMLKRSLKEIKGARQEADRANQAKDLFLATLSHELRTPLSTILSWTHMLRKGDLDAEKTKHAIQVIEENGAAQAQLIGDLLDVSRIVAGKISLQIREVDPAAAICSAVQTIQPQAYAKFINIETHFDPKVGSIMADPSRFQQIFLNLLSNSVKFSPLNSKIEIRMERSLDREGGKPWAVFKVTDYGRGIDPKFLPHIFDRFSQADSSSTRNHGGLGLGLAIVRNLVELQGGTVKAESLGEGKGATFTVCLPLKSEQKPVNGNVTERRTYFVQPGISSSRSILEGLNVLVVDDDDDAREAYTEVLRSFGAKVTAAGSASEALVRFQEHTPDVLISDIAMPIEDGYSLIHKIRALDAGRAVPAIALTAHAEADYIDQAKAAGFQAYVSKPLNFTKLVDEIASLAHPAPFR